MVLTDADLVKRCVKGEDTAYGFLIDKYKGAVYSLTQKRLGNHHDAQDTAQEVFVKAYRGLPTLRNPDCFAGWLYTIAENECRRLLQKQAREKINTLYMAELARRKQEIAFQAAQIKEKLHACIDVLPSADQEVIHMHYFDGLTCEEIGAFLGATRAAVKMRLSRARAKLSQEMTDAEPSAMPLEDGGGISSSDVATVIDLLESNRTVEDSLAVDFTAAVMKRIEQTRQTSEASPLNGRVSGAHVQEAHSGLTPGAWL